MIAAQHKNDKLTTTRDTKLYKSKKKILRWEEIRFQDFLKLSVLGESRMWRGIVFHTEGPATAKALSPFCLFERRDDPGPAIEARIHF